MSTAIAMDSAVVTWVDVATWLGPNKLYEPCSSCAQWKVLIWLHMCGRCAIEHKRRTAEAVALWKAEWEAAQARKRKEEGYAPSL
jgi:hypothetical protein